MGKKIAARPRAGRKTGRTAAADPPPVSSIQSPPQQIQDPLPPPRRSKRLQIKEEAAALPPRPLIEEEGRRLKRRRPPPRKRKTAAANQQHQQQQDVPPPILSSCTLNWGGNGKRSRSALSGRRDWSGLDDGPAGLIAERVLADDVVDYVRFRAVCRPWRRCCPDPRTRAAVLEDSRLHPRRWIMLLEEESENLGPDTTAPHCSRRRFLNVSTGQCIQVDIPELRDHDLLPSPGEGLLLLIGKATGTGGPLRLLNPLTRQVAELPPLSGLDYYPDSSRSNAGLVDGGSRVLLYAHRQALALAKPGDERWALVKFTDALVPTISFAGRFYGVTADNTIVVVDMDTTRGEGEEEQDPPPRLVVAAKLAAPIHWMTDRAHLVDNAGELMLVHRRKRRVRGADGEYNEYKRTYKVYRVNLATGKTTPAAAARGRAIFLGFRRALSVSPQVFPSLSMNTVYPALGFDGMGGNQQTRAYHLRDGSTESYSYDERSGLERPWSIADYLAAYVSGYY